MHEIMIRYSECKNTRTLAGKPLRRRRTHKIMKTLPYHGKVNNTQQYTIVQ